MLAEFSCLLFLDFVLVTPHIKLRTLILTAFFVLLLLLKAVQCQNLFLLIFLIQVTSRSSCSKTQAGQVELMSLIGSNKAQIGYDPSFLISPIKRQQQQKVGV